MAIHPLVDFHDPVLRIPSREVDPRDPEVGGAISDLWDTLKTKKGLAMAASQIGLPLRLFVFDLKRPMENRTSPPTRGVLINPRIVERSGSIAVTEGCLSFPDLDLSVTRPERVTVSGFDERGERVTYSGGGLFARMIDHEMDHLHGILLPDRQSATGRVLSAWRRFRWERDRRKGSG